VNDRGAGERTAGASIDAIATSLETAAGISAATVETEPEEIAWNSSTGASTTVGWITLTSGIGAASLCEDVDWDGREMVSMDETPAPKDCEAPTRLGLTKYRTAATPTPVPKRMVSICSKTMLSFTPDERWRGRMICGGVKGISQWNQKGGRRKRDAEPVSAGRIKILRSNEKQLKPSE